MNVENKFTSGNISVLITLFVLVVSLAATYGQVMNRLENVEKSAVQSSIDSRTLIEVSKDVAYIKEGIQRLERATSLASLPVTMCPNEKPVLVASHCRTLPMLD